VGKTNLDWRILPQDIWRLDKHIHRRRDAISHLIIERHKKGQRGVLGTLLVGVLWLFGNNAYAESNQETCLDGRYPALCNHGALSPSQLQRVEAAEHRANLSTCLDGRYPALCRHDDLTGAQALRVRLAEHTANLQSCLDGRYPALCRHGDLVEAEKAQVERAEHAANLSTCLDGRYPALCRHPDLSVNELRRVGAAESTTPGPPPAPSRTHAVALNQPNAAARRLSHGGCETGHWIESVMDDGSIIKLEDGSLWQVDDADTVDSALWLPTTEIIVCNGKLINTDDGESVEAERIK
jgi:hypothetical protein